MKKESNLLAVAKILKPQGIRGEVKVQPLVDNADSLMAIKSYIVGDKKYTAKAIRQSGGFCYIQFDGILDRNMAKTMRGLELYVEEGSKPKLEEGRYYISDVVGMTVVAGETELGKIADVMQYGSADIYSVKGDKNFMFPAINAVVLDYNIADSKLIVNKDELDKVVVYED